MNVKPILSGLSTYIPGVKRLHASNTGGTDSARYCYSIWLRHLVIASKRGLNVFPQTVAELGPGDSLGIGMASLISGAERYFAFDIVEYADLERNLRVFDELVLLFSKKESIPGDTEFPLVKPKMPDYSFPDQILTDSYLEKMLENDRIKRIRNSIINPNDADSVIKYMVPWSDSEILKEDSVDMIFSQAVLEHVDKLKDTYHSMRLWLKKDGFISHQIDFKSHGSAREWNGHWTYSDFIWKLVKGNRPYLVNREPYSTHIKLLADEGFKVITSIPVTSESNITRNSLAKKYKNLTNEDLHTSGAFIQAVLE